MSTTALIFIIVVAVVTVLLVYLFGIRWRPTQSTDEQRRPPDEQRRPRQREEQRERQTKGIFISYRRDESAAYAGRMADGFTEHFGENRVFRDIDSIEPGLDFAEAIERAVDSSEVLIAVIGRNWLTAKDAAGHKRLENPDDYVRMEIGAALQRNIRVIPVLVQGASMPSADELPDDLAPLARRNAFALQDTSWREGVQRLITRLERVIGSRSVEQNEMATQRSEGLLARVKRLVYRVGLVRGIILLIVLFILVWLSIVLVHMAFNPYRY